MVQYARFLVNSTQINIYGKETPFAGVCITTLGSFSNLGNNSYIQNLGISSFGYNRSVFVSLIAATLVGLCSGKII